MDRGNGGYRTLQVIKGLYWIHIIGYWCHIIVLLSLGKAKHVTESHIMWERNGMEYL